METLQIIEIVANMADHGVSDISLDPGLDFAEETRYNAFECLVYADSPNSVQSEYGLDDRSLCGWLAKVVQLYNSSFFAN